MPLFKPKFIASLSDEQTAALRELKGAGYTARIGMRAEAILLSARGYTIDQISEILECHRISVSRWLANWEERGIDGILEREGRGRKRSLTEEEERQVLEWLEECPWSAQKLANRIEEKLHKTVSLDTVRRLLKRCGKVWKRARSRPAGKPDEDEYHQCEQELVEYMVAAVEGEIELFYFDESGFGRAPSIPYAWQDRGHTLELPCREGKRINVMGAYSLMAGTIQVELSDKSLTSDAVTGYFDRLSGRIQKPSVVVMDNASIHTSKAFKKTSGMGAQRALYLSPSTLFSGVEPRRSGLALGEVQMAALASLPFF